MTTRLHPAACDAAVAVRLAQPHDRGEAMEEWLYTHQQGMTPPIGPAGGARHRPGDRFRREVRVDARAGQSRRRVRPAAAACSSTPTFFINGVKIEGAWQPQFFDQAIAYELQHATPK